MASSTDRSIRELNIELQLKVKELAETNEDLQTSLKQTRDKLKNYEDLSNDLSNMRDSLVKVTDALMKKRREVDNLKGRLAESENKRLFLVEKVKLLSVPQRKSNAELEATTNSTNSTVDLTNSFAAIDCENVSCVVNTFNYNQSSNYCVSLSSSALSKSTQLLQQKQKPLGRMENKLLTKVRSCHPRKSMSTEDLPTAASRKMKNVVLEAHLQMRGRRPPISNTTKNEGLTGSGTLKRKIAASKSSSVLMPSSIPSNVSRNNTGQINVRKPFRC